MDYKEVYTREYFDSRPNLDDDLNRGHFHEYAKWLARTFHFDTLADIGCGHGNMIINLHNLGKKVTGVDISPLILDVVNQKCPDIETVQDEMPHLPALGDRKFDVVVCYQVLEHLTEEDALAAIRRMYELCNRHVILSICTDLVKGAEDSTHILLRPRQWWIEKLQHEFLIMDDISYIASEEEFIIRKMECI